MQLQALRGTARFPLYLISSREFIHWLDNAPKGAWACYWSGMLVSDRFVSDMRKDIHDAQRRYAKSAEEVGGLAWAAYEGRRVRLAQRRLGPGKYDYLVLKR